MSPGKVYCDLSMGIFAQVGKPVIDVFVGFSRVQVHTPRPPLSACQKLLIRVSCRFRMASMKSVKKPSLSRRKLWAFRLIAFALTAGLILIGVEIGLRLFLSHIFVAESDSPLVPSDIPNLGYVVASNLDTPAAKTDEHGMRRRTGPAEVDHRVLLLGDSIAFGSFLQYEKSFGPQLERYLNDHMPESVGIWNASVPGYNTGQEAVRFGAVSPIVRPQVVIVEYCMNDYHERVRLTSGGVLDATGAGADKPFTAMALVNSSLAFIFFKEKVKDAQRVWPEAFPTFTHYIHHIDQKAGWKESEQALLQIQQQAEKIGAKLLVVVFPVEQQLRIGERRPQDRLKQFSSEHHIEMLDLYAALSARWREGLYVDYWNQVKMADKLHLNEQGHRIVTDQIGKYLLDRRDEFFSAPRDGNIQ